MRPSVYFGTSSGCAVNLVTKQPTAGPIRNEAFFSYDSLHSFRSSYGSGGSTTVQGLDYRFDVSRSSLNGFTDDTNTKTLNVSGGEWKKTLPDAWRCAGIGRPTGQ